MTTPEKGRLADDAIFCDTHRAVSLRLFGCPICEEQRAQRAEAERDAAKSQLNELHGYVRDMVHRLQPGHHAPDAWALRDAILAAEAERDSLREQLAAKLKAGNAFREAYEAEVERGIALREQLREAREAAARVADEYASEVGVAEQKATTEFMRHLYAGGSSAASCIARDIRALATQDNGARAGDTPKRLKLDLPTGWNTPDGCEPPEPTDTPEHPHIEGCTPYDGHDDTGCADACPHNQSALRRYGLAAPTDTKPEPTKTAQLRERNAELVKALSEMLERVDYETGDLVKDCWCTSSGNGPPGVDDVVCGACHARTALEASGKAGTR